MKKLLLLLFLIPNLVMGEWKMFQTDVYFDPETFDLISDTTIRLSTYMNINGADISDTGSVNCYIEFHCGERKYRCLKRKVWSEHNLKGQYLGDAGVNKNWKYSEKTKLYGGMMDLVCNKLKKRGMIK